MLKKCLIYDLQAVTRIWWILAASMLGASVVAGLAIRVFAETIAIPDPPEFMIFLSIFGIVGAGLCILAMVAGLTVSVILVYWRTYTHFYTDEGYLTFTLPVKRSTLYLSKVLTATIIESATVLIFVIGVAIILLIAPPSDGLPINPVVYTTLGEWLGMVWSGVGGWLVAWLLCLVPLLLGSQLYASGLVFLCLTVGSVLAKKHKLLAAIGIYYLFTTAATFVMQFITYFLASGLVTVVGRLFDKGLATGGLGISAIMLVISLMMGCVAAILHYINVHLLESKLNLA